MPFKPSHPIKHPTDVVTDPLTIEIEDYNQVVRSIAQIYSTHGKTPPAGMLSLSDSLVVSVKSFDSSDFKDEIHGSQAVLESIQKQMRNGGLNWLEAQNKNKLPVFKEKLQEAQNLLSSVAKMSHRKS